MKNKVILITGASSGLGAGLAESLHREGAHLSLFSRNPTPVANALLIAGDVTSPEDCKKAVEQTIEVFGRLDYLILNAGISMWARFDEVPDPNLLKTIMDTNYLGPVYFTHYALSHLKKTDGLIVAISSIQGKIPVAYHTGYAASKHAVQGFFETLRAENLVDILIVCPGWIRNTGIHDRAAIRLRDKGSHGLAISTCTRKILHAMKKRKKELIMPWYYRTLPWLKMLFPSFFNHMVSRTLQHKNKL
jgi:short-subunit dehydrogenase